MLFQVTFHVFKFTRHAYVPTVLQMKENIQDALANFDYFGMHDIMLEYVTPPLEWPVKVNVSVREWRGVGVGFDEGVLDNISSTRVFFGSKPNATLSAARRV